MLYMITALYCEAQIFIQHFSLKKVLQNTHFQQFASQDAQILLTVSGVGEIAAASAVSSLCTQKPPGQDDFLINAGVCAAQSGEEGAFFVHKLTEQATGKTFYPDILYRHGFQEAELVTGMIPWRKKACRTTQLPNQKAPAAAADMPRRCLYDMEAAGVYQAGAYFFAPHQMQFLKVVSDRGEGDRLSAEAVRQLMEGHRERICTYLEQLLRLVQGGDRQEDSGGRQVLDKLCADMHCSKAMQDSLSQYVRYAKLEGIDWQAAVKQMYAEQLLPCRDKREGKKCFEQVKQRLLSAVSITYLCGEAGAGSSADGQAPSQLSGRGGN